MNDKTTLWKIILSGPRIQGIGLRDKITEYCNIHTIKGRIKNLPTGYVEVIFLEEEKTLDEFLKGLSENVFHPMKKSGILKATPEIRKKEITDELLLNELVEKGKFFVEPADDLQEIVWALKGAGEVFNISAKEVRKIVKNQRQEKKTRLDSLITELSYSQPKLASIKEKEHQLICLRHFLEEPMIEDEDVIKRLVKFYYEFMDFIQRKEEEKDKRKRAKLIEDMSKEFEAVLKLLKDYGSNITNRGVK